MALDQQLFDHVTKKTENFSKSKNGQWYPMAFFLRKMIPAKIQCKTHNQELLTIVEAFKTRCHYLEGCKYKVLMLTNHNNFFCFMDIKSSSSKQIRWA